MTQILVIEDDAVIAELLTHDLELEGYQVDIATDGLAGLERFKSIKPDLLILDLRLPKLSGYDVCKTIRKDGSNTPIIMLTAKGQEAEKAVGLDHGADDYVTKPYGSIELMARIRALLRRHGRQED